LDYSIKSEEIGTFDSVNSVIYLLIEVPSPSY